MEQEKRLEKIERDIIMNRILIGGLTLVYLLMTINLYL